MNLRQCILYNNDCYIRGLKIKPKGIMVHSTGADNPKLKRYLAPDDGFIGQNDYNNHWNMSGVGACVHAFIGLDKFGDVQVYQTLPWNHRGWHCGASGNDTHISFEICEDALADRDYWLKTKNLAVELCAYLCNEYDFDPMGDGVILDHITGYERGIASGHSDIRHWWNKFNYTLEDFRKEVLEEMLRIDENRVKELIDEALESKVPMIVDKVKELMSKEKTWTKFEDLPKWAKNELLPMYEAGVIKGDGHGNINLTESMARLLVIMWRVCGNGKSK